MKELNDFEIDLNNKSINHIYSENNSLNISEIDVYKEYKI